MRKLAVALWGLSVLAGCGGSSPLGSELLTPEVRADTPVVDAGPARVGDEGQMLTLNGEASGHEGRAIAYVEWSQIDPDDVRAEFPANRNQDSLSVRLPQVAEDRFLTFQFEATDEQGVSARDTVRVRVRDVIDNQLPIARAGPSQTVDGSQNVVLDGCASEDPDGRITAFEWQDLDSGEVLGRDCAVTTGVQQGPRQRTLTFELTVTDNLGARAHDRTQVTVRPSASNQPPRITGARAEPPEARPGEEALLRAEAIDPDDHPLTYRWQQVEGPFVVLRGAQTSEARFVAPDDHAMPLTLRFAVTVSDGVASDHAELSVVVDDAPPAQTVDFIACAGNPFQRGCPLAPLGRLTGIGEPVTCLSDPFSENCPFGLLVSLDPGLADCLDDPGLSGCTALLNNLLTPSFFVEQLNPVDSAGSCNPRYFPEAPYPHFWGALHEHTAYSDGTLGTTPTHVFDRVRSIGWDFAIITDHSDNLAIPLPLPSADCLSARFLECILADPDEPLNSFFKWDATAAAALRASDEAFTAIRGFEWTSDRFGHANVLFSRNNLNAKAEPGYAVDMSLFWAWFQYPARLGGGDDGLIVFNHPGREDLLHGGLEAIGLGDPAYTFNNFRYVPGADYRTVGVEVFGKGDEYDLRGRGGSWFGTALDQGWFLAPAGSEDHHGVIWGDPSLPKTVLIARTRAAEDLREAMLARRMYAVAQRHNDLRLDFEAADGSPMGSRLVRPPGSAEILRYRVSRAFGEAPGAPDLVVELMTSARDNRQGYQPASAQLGPDNTFTVSVTDRREWYFLRVRQAEDNRIIAVSAPIWIQPGEMPLPSCPSR